MFKLVRDVLPQKPGPEPASHSCVSSLFICSPVLNKALFSLSKAWLGWGGLCFVVAVAVIIVVLQRRP